jgi:tRNA(Ile)-lysidine synthase
MLGRKKINDIFIDEKISLGERETWPIVLDSSDKVVWLPGLKKSKYDKEKNEKYDIIIKYY